MLRVPTIAETLATARALNETHTGQQVSSDWGQGVGENVTRQSHWRLGYKKDTYLLFPHLIPTPLISGCVLLFFGSYMAPCTRHSKAIEIADNMQLDNMQLTIADNRASLEAATQKDAGNIQHQRQTIGTTTGTTANLKGKSQLSRIRPI